MSTMATMRISHTQFSIQRDFSAAPSAVFAAWADPEVKRRWSDCHPEQTTDYSLDFRPYGRGHHRVQHTDGTVQIVEKLFFDIVTDQRIVFSYDICVNDRRLSVSLVTVEFVATPTGTRMHYVEQLAYLDGHHDLAARQHGTEEGFDRLALELMHVGRVQ